MTKKNRQILYLITGALSFFVIVHFVTNLFFINSSKACATFYKIGTSSYVDYYHYSFDVGGKKCKGSIEKGDLKIRSLDSLKKIKCVEVEYSIYNTIYNRVIDSRVLNE